MSGMANYSVKMTSAPKGHEIPPLLRDVAAFVGKQKHGSLGWFDALSVAPIPKEWSVEAAERLRANGFAFLHLPDGSQLALMKADGKAPAAVVLLGSEGEARTVADSLEEFLTLWAKGATEISDLDDDDASGRKALAAWLKANKVKPPKVARSFDFESWLAGPAAAAPSAKTKKKGASTPPKATASAKAPTPTMKALGPKVQALASIMGLRADAPEVAAYVTKVLGKKVPQSTSDRNDSANVSADKVGVELVFSHEILNPDFPPITKTGKTFVPYVSHAWVREAIKEPVLGVPWGADVDAITKVLGAPTGVRTRFAGDKTPTVSFWKRDLGGGVELEISHHRGMNVELTVRSAVHLEKFPDVGTSLFIAWAATRGLLDAAAFGPHAGLVAQVAKREAQASELVKASMPYGLWDTHLKDLPELRSSAYAWFHRLDKTWIKDDLKKTFGARPGPHGHEEPKVDDDTWPAVDKAAKAFEARFRPWLK